MTHTIHEIVKIFIGNSLHTVKSDYLRDVRSALNYSMGEVARETGISKPTISRIEQGKDCKYSSIVALSDFYDKELRRLYVEKYKPRNI